MMKLLGGVGGKGLSGQGRGNKANNGGAIVTSFVPCIHAAVRALVATRSYHDKNYKIGSDSNSDSDSSNPGIAAISRYHSSLKPFLHLMRLVLLPADTTSETHGRGGGRRGRTSSSSTGLNEGNAMGALSPPPTATAGIRDPSLHYGGSGSPLSSSPTATATTTATARGYTLSDAQAAVLHSCCATGQGLYRPLIRPVQRAQEPDGHYGRQQHCPATDGGGSGGRSSPHGRVQPSRH